MSATNFLSNALRSSIDSFGSEDVTVNGQRVSAVLDPLTAQEDLGLGSSTDQRTITLLYRSADLTFQPQKGQTVQARGQDWLINLVSHHPQTTTTLTLHSPTRLPD